MQLTQTTLPLFPLGVVLIPGESIKLHIFEPRYKQLIQDCRSEELTFGIPFTHKSKLYPYGTAVKVIEIEKEYDNGELDIVVQGVHTFKLVRFIEQLPDKLYSGGLVESHPTAEGIHSSALSNVFSQFSRMFNNVNEIASETYDHLTIGAQINLRPEQKYYFISLDSGEKQVDYLLNQMKFLMIIKEQEDKKFMQFYMN